MKVELEEVIRSNDIITVSNYKHSWSPLRPCKNLNLSWWLLSKMIDQLWLIVLKKNISKEMSNKKAEVAKKTASGGQFKSSVKFFTALISYFSNFLQENFFPYATCQFWSAFMQSRRKTIIVELLKSVRKGQKQSPTLTSWKNYYFFYFLLFYKNFMSPWNFWMITQILGYRRPLRSF